MNNFNLQTGITPPPAPMNPQVQVILGQLQGHINNAIAEKTTGLAQTLADTMGRMRQLEEVLAEVIKRVSTKKPDDVELFDAEERRIIILNSSGFLDKKEIRTMWDNHQKSKVSPVEEVTDVLSGE